MGVHQRRKRKKIPHLILGAEFVDDMDPSFSCVILVSDLVGSADRFQALYAFALFTDVNVDISSHIQDEAVSFVHRSYGRADLLHPDISLSLDLEQPLLERVPVDVGEARTDSPRQVANSVLEVGKE